MRSEKGITLIKLCFVIVLIGILFAMFISALKSSFEATNLQKFVIKMELLQEKVNVIRREYKIWEEYDPNESGNYYEYLKSFGFINADSKENKFTDEFNQIIKMFNESEIEYWNKDVDSILANYYYFSPEDIKKYFEVSDFDTHIIINFYTGNIIAKDSVEDVNTNKMIYRQYDAEIGNSLNIVPIVNEETTVDITVLENYGLRQKIKVALKSPSESILKPNIDEIFFYRLEDKNQVKKKCTELVDYVYNSKEKYATFTIDRSGTYSFIVKDSNSTEYTKIDYEIMLCNPPVVVDGLIGVYWDEDGVEYSIASSSDGNWYNYSKTNLKMANAKDEYGNYWVWIPRYIYMENNEQTNLDFVTETTTTSTENVATTYKLHPAFEDGVKGLWVAKYQSNFSKGKISIKPGKTLTIAKSNIAKEYCTDYVSNLIRPYADLISTEELDSVRVLSNSYGLTIANDLVHYAGGSPNEKEIINNTKYSSSNNISGVFDTETSEVEITRNSEVKEGRFRPVLIIK